MDRKDPWSVGAWMTDNPATVGPNALTRDAFFTMRHQGYRHLLVVDGDRLLGIVTDRDLRRPDLSQDADGWNDYYRLDSDYRVEDIMTRDPLTAHTHQRLEKALDTMIERKIGALPVLDKREQVIGILTTHDLMRAFAQALQNVGGRLREVKR